MLNFLNIHILSEYIYFIIFFFLIFFISIFLFLLSFLIDSYNFSFEKLSSYECGFEPFEDTRTKFDIKFYLVSILFLIFDIEIIFLFP